MKTKYLSSEEAQKQVSWKLVDATGIPVGRLASQVASIIRGKDKPSFTPNNKCGDNVIVINAEKVAFTGKKLQNKVYYHHTNFIGGLKERKASDLMKSNPTEVIEIAVFGMLPKGNLGHQMKKKLRVFKGAEHGIKVKDMKTVTLALAN